MVARIVKLALAAGLSYAFVMYRSSRLDEADKHMAEKYGEDALRGTVAIKSPFG